MSNHNYSQYSEKKKKTKETYRPKKVKIGSQFKQISYKRKVGHNWGNLEYGQDIKDIRGLLLIFLSVIM